MVKDIKGAKDISPKIAVEKNLKSLSLKGFNVKPTADYLESRVAVLINNDCHISLAAPQQSMTDYFYKNADCDEMVFVHKGTGTLRTIVGNLKYGPGDYLMIPRGMIYAFQFDTEDNRLFIVESTSPMYTPKRYRNWFGQLLEHSPFCERDLRQPQDLETHDELGDFYYYDKKGRYVTRIRLRFTPF